MNRIVAEDVASIAKQGYINWQALASSRILVTGASGFIASYIVHLLMYLSDTLDLQVFALVRNKERACLKFNDYINNDRFELIVQDVNTFKEYSDRIDYVIHAASQASPKYYGVDPVGTLSANVLGTYNLLNIAAEKKVKKVLFVSGGEIYGAPSKIPTAESDYGYLDHLSVRACYAESKRMAENMCVCFGAQYQVPYNIVRLYHTYGPGVDLQDGRVFADFVRNVIEGENIVLNSDGQATRAFCYIADVVAGIFCVMLNGQPGECFNLGSDQETRIVDLAEILVRLYPEKKLQVIFNHRKRDDISYLASPISKACPDINKIKGLGWEPRMSVREGFRRTIESIFQAKILIKS